MTIVIALLTLLELLLLAALAYAPQTADHAGLEG
jgi:hypothetical protein